MRREQLWRSKSEFLFDKVRHECRLQKLLDRSDSRQTQVVEDKVRGVFIQDNKFVDFREVHTEHMYETMSFLVTQESSFTLRACFRNPC